MNTLGKTYLYKIVGFRVNALFKYSPKKAVEKSFKLFSTPRKGKVKPDQKSFLDKARNGKITVQNLEIQTYAWPNTGKTVLLIHGWESNTARWRDLVSALQKENYTVLSLDAPAHGNSEGGMFNVFLYAEAISKLIEKYKPEFAVGHSVGASTLIFQHYNYPSRTLEKMVLLAPPSEMVHLMAGFQTKLGLKPKLMKALETYFKERFGYGFSDFSMLKFVKNLTSDAFFIHDKDDIIVNWKESETIVEKWENARLLITKGKGHSLMGKSIDAAIGHFLKDN